MKKEQENMQTQEQQNEPEEEEKLPRMNEKELEDFLLEAAREEQYLKLNMENE